MILVCHLTFLLRLVIQGYIQGPIAFLFEISKVQSLDKNYICSSADFLACVICLYLYNCFHDITHFYQWKSTDRNSSKQNVNHRWWKLSSCNIFVEILQLWIFLIFFFGALKVNLLATIQCFANSAHSEPSSYCKWPDRTARITVRLLFSFFLLGHLSQRQE